MTRGSRPVLALAAALPLLLVACRGERATTDPALANDAPQSGGTAVFCATQVPGALNPFTSPDLVTADLRLLLFTPLVLYDSAGGVRPYLASAWSWGDGNRTLRFTLRRDVHWHDGQPVTAADVAWTLRIAADTLFPYPGSRTFAGLRDILVPDSETVELHFDAPFAAGLEPFIALPILPRHLLADVPAADFARAPYNRDPVGSGPFRIAGRTADGALRLERVSDFPEALGRPLLDRLVIRAVPEPATVLIEMQTGGVDGCLTGSSLARDARNRGLDVLGIAPEVTQAIPLDVRKPPFSDVRVRRALSAALDRTALAAVVSPAAHPARTYLPAGAARWLDTSLLEPDADTALAATLLDSAGWLVRAADGMRANANGEPLRITILAAQSARTVLTVVQAQLRDVGVDAQLRLMEPNAYVATLMNPATRPAAMLLAFSPDRVLIPDPYSQLNSGGDSNLGSWADPHTDSLTERLRGILPDDERTRIYHELQRIIARDVPVIYTVYAPRSLVLTPRLHGVTADRNGPFGSAAHWWIPTTDRRAGDAARDSTH